MPPKKRRRELLILAIISRISHMVPSVLISQVQQPCVLLFFFGLIVNLLYCSNKFSPLSYFPLFLPEKNPPIVTNDKN